MTSTSEGASSPTGARPALAPPTATAAAQPAASPVVAAAPSPSGRLIASVVGHLAFGALVLGGVLFWQNYPKVLTPMADTVCADHLLGQYRSAPGTMLAAESGAVAKGATAEKSAAPASAAAPPATATTAAKVPPTSADTSSQPATAKTVVGASEPPAGAKAEAVAAATPVATPPPAPAPSGTGTVSGAPAPGPEQVTGASRSAAASEREPSALPQPTKTRPVATVPQPAVPAPASTVAAPAPAAASAAPSAPALAPPTAASPAQAQAKVATSGEPAKLAPPAAAAPLAERWQSARTAYRSGDPKAIERYAQLIKDFPDVADLPGELGNIYYGAGRMQDAAEQYFEAAQRHLRGQSPGMASCLVGVLKRLNSPLADKLAEQARTPCPLATQDAGKGARSG